MVKLRKRKFWYIRETECGTYLFDEDGYIMDGNKMFEVANELLKSSKNTNLINEYNIQNFIEKTKEAAELYKQMEECECSSKKKEEKKYIYLFECGGKYKIGITNDIERRTKELNLRPFKLNLIALSGKIADAYELEQALHSEFSEYRISGEWYEFSDEIVLKLKKIISELKEA